MKYFDKVNSCRLCASTKLDTVISLPDLPVASPNVGGIKVGNKENVMAPANVCQCESCGFLQLAVVINPEYQYKNFLYKTDISLGLKEHFDTLMDKLEDMGDLKAECTIFDVGSNDGSLLALAKQRGCTVLGIDPAIEIAKIATSEGIPTYGDFFSFEKAQEISKKHGLMDIIISNNTVANIHNLNDLFAGFHHLLKDEGLLVIETQYALDVLEKKLLDVIYHEHISYFSVKPMQRFMDNMGFQLINAECISPKGGSIRFIMQKKNGPRFVNDNVLQLIRREEQQGLYDKKLFSEFNQFIKETGEKLKIYLMAVKEKTGYVFAYGASVGCSALIHYFSICDLIDKIFDDNPLSLSLNVNGKSLTIEHGNNLLKYTPVPVVVLAWRYLDAISKKQQAYIQGGGEFFSVF